MFYHLLTIYFGVGDYCLSNSLTSCLFSSQSSSLYWLKSANTDKTITPNRAQQEGPNQLVHRSYPILQNIEAYSGRHTHQLCRHHRTKD